MFFFSSDIEPRTDYSKSLVVYHYLLCHRVNLRSLALSHHPTLIHHWSSFAVKFTTTEWVELSRTRGTKLKQIFCQWENCHSEMVSWSRDCNWMARILLHFDWLSAKNIWESFVCHVFWLVDCGSHLRVIEWRSFAAFWLVECGSHLRVTEWRDFAAFWLAETILESPYNVPVFYICSFVLDISSNKATNLYFMFYH